MVQTLIEKTIRTSSFKIVTPDIIAVFNRYTHSLVFDCKGGTNIEDDQVSRYETLKKEDFVNWIDTYSRDQLRFDVCIADFENNHSEIMTHVGNFPVISFGNDKIVKDNFFKINALPQLAKSIDEVNPEVRGLTTTKQSDIFEI